MKHAARHGTTTAISRRALLGSAGGVGIGLLAGCSGSGGSASGPTSSTAASSSATRTVSTVRGPVQVPSNPQRVVCLDPGFSWQTLLGIGVTPVGLPIVVDAITLPGLLAQAKRIPTVVTSSGAPDLEKIAALKPDLILTADSGGPDANAKLRPIAPVATYRFGFPSDWPTLAHGYADAVNRVDRLAGVTAAYRQRVATIKQRYGRVISRRKWALVTQNGSQVFVWGVKSSAGPVLSAAGAAFSSGAPGASAPFQPTSLERIDSLSDAGVILYGADVDGTPYGDTAQLLGQSVFKRLPAVRAGHVYALPSWFAYGYQDATAQLAGLEKVCAALARS